MADTSKDYDEKNVGRASSFSKFLPSPLRSPNPSSKKRSSSSKGLFKMFSRKKSGIGGDVDEPSLPEPIKEIGQTIIDMAQEGPPASKDEADLPAKPVNSSTESVQEPNFIEKTIKVVEDSKKELQEKANEGMKTAERSIADAKETAANSVDDAKKTATDSLDDVKKTATRGLDDVKKTAKDSFEDVKETAHRGLDNFKDAFNKGLGNIMHHKDKKSSSSADEQQKQQNVEQKETIDDEKKQPLQLLTDQLTKTGNIITSQVTEEVGRLVESKNIADQSSSTAEKSLSKEDEDKDKIKDADKEKEEEGLEEDDCVTSLAQGLNKICASWSPKKQD